MLQWSSLPRPILCLAPMAGYTDSPYRQMVKEICPSVICFTEFTNVDGILHGNEATLRQVMFNPEAERPIVAQIFGKKPEHFRKASRVLTELGVDAIDINMGCPAKKVISSDCGSSLLKSPALAEEIVRATVEGTPLEVSVKMRIGTSCYNPDSFFDMARRMEAAGARAITIHGRTSKQMYGGTADWQPMYELKKMLNIPVIGNGDIKSGTDALAKIGNLDGVMVGRGSFGNPWVFCEILAAFAGRPYTAPSFEKKIPTMLRHLDLAYAFYDKPNDERSSGSRGFPLRSEQREGGASVERSETERKWGKPQVSPVLMRKQFAWYIRGIPHASILRQKLMAALTREEIMRHMQSFPELQQVPNARAMSMA